MRFACKLRSLITEIELDFVLVFHARVITQLDDIDFIQSIPFMHSFTG